MIGFAGEVATREFWVPESTPLAVHNSNFFGSVLLNVSCFTFSKLDRASLELFPFPKNAVCEIHDALLSTILNWWKHETSAQLKDMKYAS